MREPHEKINFSTLEKNLKIAAQLKDSATFRLVDKEIKIEVKPYDYNNLFNYLTKNNIHCKSGRYNPSTEEYYLTVAKNDIDRLVCCVECDIENQLLINSNSNNNNSNELEKTMFSQAIGFFSQSIQTKIQGYVLYILKNSKDRKKEDSKSVSFEELSSDILLYITDFLKIEELYKMSQLSKKSFGFYTSSILWHRKLASDHKVSPRFLSMIEARNYKFADLIFYKRLTALHKVNKRFRTSKMLASVLNGEVDEKLFVDCLMDDLSLLKKIPYEDLAMWFGLSCLAGCKALPKRTLSILPINQELFDCYVVRSGNLELVKDALKMNPRIEVGLDSIENALLSENLELLKFLVALNKQPFLSCLTQVLNDALYLGNLKLVKYLMSEFKFKLDHRCLNKAMVSGNIDVVKFIIESGVESEADLHLAAKSGKSNFSKSISKRFYQS